MDGAFEREQDKRNFGTRIGVGDRAANRSAAAGLRVADPGQRGGQERLAFVKLGPCQKFRLPYASADADGIRVAFDFRELRQMHDVDQDFRACHPHRQHRHQALSAGEDAGILSLGGKRGMRLRQRPGAQVVEAGGLQDSPRARSGACSAG